MFLFTEDNLRHHMPIKHIISMFEQKVAKNFEEIVLLKGNIICFIKFTYNPIYICLKTGLCNEYGWFIRVFFYILIINYGKIIKKNFKSKIYGKLTTIKLIILSFRLYLCSYSMYLFVDYGADVIKSKSSSVTHPPLRSFTRILKCKPKVAVSVNTTTLGVIASRSNLFSTETLTVSYGKFEIASFYDFTAKDSSDINYAINIRYCVDLYGEDVAMIHSHLQPPAST